MHGSVRRTLAGDSNGRCLCRSFQRTSKHTHGAGPPAADGVSTPVHTPGSRQCPKGHRRLFLSHPAAWGVCSQGDKGHTMPQGEGWQRDGQAFWGAAHHAARHCHSLQLPPMTEGMVACTGVPGVPTGSSCHQDTGIPREASIGACDCVSLRSDTVMSRNSSGPWPIDGRQILGLSCKTVMSHRLTALGAGGTVLSPPTNARAGLKACGGHCIVPVVRKPLSQAEIALSGPCRNSILSQGHLHSTSQCTPLVLSSLSLFCLYSGVTRL